MKLNDRKCKELKPKDKPFKVTDGGSLYLEVMPNGSKYWRMSYRFLGKHKRLAFGVYPRIPAERKIQDYRSTYNDIRDWLRREKVANEKEKSIIDWDDVVFEVDLLKSQEINLDYIFWNRFLRTTGRLKTRAHWLKMCGE